MVCVNSCHTWRQGQLAGTSRSEEVAEEEDGQASPESTNSISLQSKGMLRVKESNDSKTRTEDVLGRMGLMRVGGRTLTSYKIMEHNSLIPVLTSHDCLP